MPDPSLYTTHTIDTHPLRLPDGAVVGAETKIASLEWLVRLLRLDVGNLKAGKAGAEEAWRNECTKSRGLANQVADLKAELAKRDAKTDAMPIPPSSPGVIELLIAVDETIRYFRHRHLNRPDCETINLLEDARKGIVGMPCDVWMSREEHDKAIAEWLKANDQWAAELDRLRAELAKQDETIAELHADRDTLSKDYITAGYERDKTIASLRSQLARGGAIEAKAKAIYETGDELLGQIEGGFSFYREGRECEELAAFRAALVAFGQRHPASPGPSVTPDGERPSSAEGIAALRAAGGSDWDKIADVRAFLGRDEDENLSRLLESVLAAIEEYNSNFAHMTYKDDAMKAMVKAYADYVAPEAHL